MANFAVTLHFESDVEHRLSVRPSHREYLKTLLDSGSLVQSGPFLDDSGALLIYDAADQAAAEALLAADPYSVDGGVIASSTIKEWNIVISKYA